MAHPLNIHVAGRLSPISYPPPPDVTYGELTRLTRLARKLGLSTELASLEESLRTFFDDIAISHKPAPTARQVEQAQTMREAKQRNRDFLARQGHLFNQEEFDTKR